MSQSVKQTTKRQGDRYLTIFEQIPDPLIILDKENWIEQLNDAASELLRGLPGSDTGSAGKDGERDTLSWLRQELEAFSAAGKPEYRCEKVMEAAGGIRYFEVSIKGITHANKNPDGTIVVLHDITPQRLAEEARRQAEECYGVFTNIPLVGMYIVQEGRFCYVNAAMTTALGYGTDDIVGKMEPLDLVHPDDRPMMEEYYRRRLVGEEVPSAYACKIKRKDGGFSPCLIYIQGIDYGGKPALVGMAVDVTERKRAERDLREKEQLLVNIINATPDFIFVKNTGLRIMLCNEAYAAAIGKKPHELIGHTDIENGWDPELVKGNPAKGIRGFESDDLDALSGKVVHSPDVPAKIGTEIRIADTYKLPLYDEDKKILGVLGIAGHAGPARPGQGA